MPASLSGTSSIVASQDTSRSPHRNAPGAPGPRAATQAATSPAPNDKVQKRPQGHEKDLADDTKPRVVSLFNSGGRDVDVLFVTLAIVVFTACVSPLKRSQLTPAST